MFAVFNPAWVTESLKHNVWFAEFDSVEHPSRGWKTFDTTRMPVYIRDESEYNDIAARYGLTNIMTDRPPFTDSFLAKYPDYFPNNVPEYLILGYTKK